MSERFEKYKTLAEGRSAVSIPYLAAAANVTEPVVLADLQQMVVRGMFGAGAYINYATKMLVLRDTTHINGANWGEAIGKTMGQVAVQVADAVKSASAAVKKASADRPPAPRPAPAPRAKKPPRIKKHIGRAVWGGYLAMFALAMAASYVQNDMTLATGYMNLLVGAGALVWCGFSFKSFAAKRRLSRINAYKFHLNGRSRVSIGQLAMNLELPFETVMRDFAYMQKRHIFGVPVTIDAASATLHVGSPGAGTPPPRREEAQPTPPAKGNQYYDILCEIRQLNDDISDETVSAHIYEIEKITAKIFKIVEDKPEKEPQIKSFMSYYLPTTLKLLRSYRTFEKQGVGGDNIDKAKSDITRILEQLVQGFGQQLDQLFKADALDISTDIQVLETMMKRDGLGNGESDFPTAAGTQ